MIQLLLFSFLAASVCAADLSSVKSEPILERRSERALDNADKALSEAKGAYKLGDASAMKEAITEVRESVELALQALRDTGKHPTKMTKHYKRGELKTRQLLRRLEGFAQEMGVEERETVEILTRRVHDIHDDFLNGVMSKKKS